MAKHLVIVDKPGKLVSPHPDRLIVKATDYIAGGTETGFQDSSKLKVINLCRDYSYLSKGYYCSLLADARSHRAMPSVPDIMSLNSRRIYQSALPELNQLLEKTFSQPLGEQIAVTYLIYFGRTESKELQAFGRRVFDIFRSPIIAVELKHTGKWTISKVEAWSIYDIPPEKIPFFNRALDLYTGAAWTKASSKKKSKYWLAILHDPKEKMPPSNKLALKKFLKAGEEMNLFIELITKADMSSLLEYDALFIRETTSINHHTFRFARKAEEEDIPCIDDTLSMLRCGNKVFLHELLSAHKIPVPETTILDPKKAAHLAESLAYPLVLKIPDGSFSRGIHKIESAAQFRKVTEEMFKKSEILLAQEFLPSAFDWRVGVLNGKPLFACQYFMARDHWQVVNHGTSRKGKIGNHKTWDINDVPHEVVTTAVKAAGLIGQGLYGVDLKQTERGVVVIEVNDNPNIDAGVEDEVLGPKLYRQVLEHFIGLIEA